MKQIIERKFRIKTNRLGKIYNNKNHKDHKEEEERREDVDREEKRNKSMGK